MKYKILFVINILIILFCAGVIVYEIAFADNMNIKMIAKASILFITFALSMLKIRPKRSPLDKKIYTDTYKYIICDAFNNDRHSYNKLIDSTIKTSEKQVLRRFYEQTDKPGSVVCGNLSRLWIAPKLKPSLPLNPSSKC